MRLSCRSLWVMAALLSLTGGLLLGTTGCTSKEDTKSAEPAQYQAPKDSFEKSYGKPGGAGAPAGGAAPAPAPPGPAAKP